MDLPFPNYGIYTAPPPVDASLMPLTKQIGELQKLQSPAYKQEQKKKTEKKKDREFGYYIKVATFSTILFIILSQNIMYNILNRFWKIIFNLPQEIITENGGRTLKGIFIMGGVYFIIIMFLVK